MNRCHAFNRFHLDQDLVCYQDIRPESGIDTLPVVLHGEADLPANVVPLFLQLMGQANLINRFNNPGPRAE